MNIDRQGAIDQLSVAIARTRERQDLFTTIMVRLSGLRTLRKHMGFDATDTAIRLAHDRLLKALPAGDWLGRISDDEFLVVSFDCNSPSCAIKGSTSSLQVLQPPLQVDSVECDLQPHAGIAVFPVDGQTPDELMRNALAATDHAQEADAEPGYAFFSHELGQRANDDFVLQQALRRAISKSEFSLHLQPKFMLIGGALIGAEALLRWPQPDGLLRPPGEFIPVAERGRLMRPLGRWVSEEAVRVLADWRHRGVQGVPLAINVAADQLASDDWVSSLQSQVNAGRLDPADLVCEITESVALHDGAATTARLERLNGIGIKISVDDFGVGYSNLAALARFPFDEVKIDRSLVSGLGIDDSRQRICQAVATMGAALGMAVLAEGIETEAQARVAQDIGCQRTQGFLYGRPIPVAQFETTWLTHRA